MSLSSHLKSETTEIRVFMLVYKIAFQRGVIKM